MTSPKLSVYDFGKQLIDANDLDPIYVMLWEANLDHAILHRWLLAYWSFYHSGTASWIVGDGTELDYWRRMREAAASKEYPRCSERRHFRGKLATTSVAWLADRGIRKLLAPIVGESLTLRDVISYVKTWYGFGDWIAFKVADMLERLDIAQVRFDDSDAFLFDSPREGAELARQLFAPAVIEPAAANRWALSSITTQLELATPHGAKKPGYLAPPRYERAINAQEVETILCKWKSYMNGHYEIGEDVAALRKSLLKFARCRLSQKLLAAGKQGGLW